MNRTEKYIQPLLDLFQGEPRVQAALVAVLSFAAAYIFTGVLKALLKRLAQKTSFTFDDKIVEIIRPPLFYSMLMVGWSIAVQIAPIPAGSRSIVMSVLQSMSVVIWTIFAIRLAKILLHTIARQQRKPGFVQPRTLPLFDNLATIIAIALSIYLIFNAWGVDMTAWLASAGVVGIAVGFAAKDTLANLISGVFILTDAPYKIGDFIVLSTGERGEVTDIGIRSTRLLTRDDVELTIPNSIMGNSKVVNETGGPHEKFRIRIPVGVAYGTVVSRVREILTAIAEKNEKVCKLPAPRTRFRKFGPSSLDFELLCWVELPVMRGQVVDLLLEEIYIRFQEAGIEIPYNKQDVYIKEMPERRQGQLDPAVAAGSPGVSNRS